MTFFDKDGEEKLVKVPVGMSVLEAAHANDIELDGIPTIKYLLRCPFHISCYWQVFHVIYIWILSSIFSGVVITPLGNGFNCRSM